MKIVKVRMKRGIIRHIKQNQKVYDYICPLKNIKVGDFVLVDVFINKADTFGVARIEEIYELSKEKVEDKGIYGFCVMKLPEDFYEHCNKMRDIKVKLLSRYNGAYHVKKKKEIHTRLK